MTLDLKAQLRARSRCEKLLALALHNPEPHEAVAALGKLQQVAALNGLALCIQALQTSEQDQESCKPSDREPDEQAEPPAWSAAWVWAWVGSAQDYCVRAAECVLRADEPLSGRQINLLAGAPDNGRCVLAGAQAWATRNGLPHPFRQDELGGWVFSGRQVERAFRRALRA